MDVKVRLFAAYADLFGADDTTVTIAPPATVGALRDSLRASESRLPQRLLIAVNDEYADDSRAISPGDEVALIPPVAGG